MEQSLRYLTVRLETSGTATLLENTEIYKGSYAFIWLRAFVPVTQNRAEGLNPICTVHAVVTDKLGFKRQVGNTYYNMYYVETRSVNGKDFLVFERKMPKPFTDTVGDLEILYNYSEITEDGKLFARMTTNVLHKSVVEGGETDGEIDVDLDLEAVAQINKNALSIERLNEDIGELKLGMSVLSMPIDNSEADQVSTPDNPARLEIQNGRIKAIAIKGSTGSGSAGVVEITSPEKGKIKIEYADKQPQVLEVGLTQEQEAAINDAVSIANSAKGLAESLDLKKQNKILVTDTLPPDAEDGDFVFYLIS